MTYLKKNNIDKNMYEINMYKIYNNIAGHKNEQLQDKAASETTFQAVKTFKYPIRYLMIL